MWLKFLAPANYKSHVTISSVMAWACDFLISCQALKPLDPAVPLGVYLLIYSLCSSFNQVNPLRKKKHPYTYSNTTVCKSIFDCLVRLFSVFKPNIWKDFRYRILYKYMYTVIICYRCFLIFQIYRKTYGQHVGFKMFSDAILLSLTRKVMYRGNCMSVLSH